jgi:CDP-paratose 2-epimerase
MKYLITGGCGFIGSNLAKRVLELNQQLIVVDDLSRYGSELNLEWLKHKGEFKFINKDITVATEVDLLIKKYTPDFIFHLAGQVAMTKSIKFPRRDFEINTIGTLNILESVRKFSPETIILYSSSNKVYGDLEHLIYEENETRYLVKDFPFGFNEDLNLNFQSPYGCSKGAADQYLLDYNKIFGLKTVVFRHSSMYGGNQHPTFDQGWISWFCQKAIEIRDGKLDKNFTVSGNGKQVRDLLYCDDVVNLYFKCVENIDKVKGEAFNIGGGFKNSLSILELFSLLENSLNISMTPYVSFIEKRNSDQLSFVATNEKIFGKIKWRPETPSQVGINNTLEWLSKYHNSNNALK